MQEGESLSFPAFGEAGEAANFDSCSGEGTWKEGTMGFLLAGFRDLLVCWDVSELLAPEWAW